MQSNDLKIECNASVLHVEAFEHCTLFWLLDCPFVPFSPQLPKRLKDTGQSQMYDMMTDFRLLPTLWYWEMEWSTTKKKKKASILSESVEQHVQIAFH